MRASFLHRILTVSLIGASVFASHAALAQKTNVVLQASISGTLGKRGNLGTNTRQAGFSTDTFLTIVGINPNADTVMAISFDMVNTGTNVSLVAWDKANEGPIAGGALTTGERTVFLTRGDEFTFDTSATVPSRFPNFAGGHLDIAGRGRLLNGKPTAVSAAVRGFLVDANPVDLGGTTGIVIRASLKSGGQLRELPK